MSPSKWAAWLLGLLAPSGRKDEVVGDLAEAHRRRLEQRGWLAVHAFIGASTFELISKAVSPTIPLPEGDRIVALRCATPTLRALRIEPGEALRVDG